MSEDSVYLENEIDEVEKQCRITVLKALKDTFSASFDEHHVNKLSPDDQQQLQSNLHGTQCSDCPYVGTCPYIEDLADDSALITKVLQDENESEDEDNKDGDGKSDSSDNSDHDDDSVYSSMSSKFEVQKARDDQQLVFGWANVSVKADGTLPFDWQGDIKTPETLEKAAYDFVLKYRDTGEMHTGGTKGKLVESVMFTKEKMQAMGIPDGVLPEGWWVGFHIPDKEVFAKIKNKQYNMFSIQGKAKRIPLDKGGDK